MKVIAKKLWEEPAYFLGAIALVGSTLLQVISLPDYIEIPLNALFIGGAAQQIRSKVVPLGRTAPPADLIDDAAGNVVKP